MVNLLIDGDLIAYRTCMSKETAVDWGEGLWTLHCFEDDVKAGINNYLSAFRENIPNSRPIIYLSSTENFRKGVDPSYKSNRAATRKPICLKVIREWMIFELGAVIVQGLEADDLLGIHGTDPAKKTVVVSDDKDMRTLPCVLWNSKAKMLETISLDQADYNHMIQTLTGDATDGYAGCPSVGPKTAEKILTPKPDQQRTPSFMWEQVVKAFDKAGLSEEEALRQARLARILRHGEFSFDTGKPVLWEPPSISKH